MKIIYVFERRHCYNYDYDMFQFDAFLKHGWEVECWSAVNWTFSGIDIPRNEDKSERSHYINDEDDLICNLERVKNEECFFLIFPYAGYERIPHTIRRNIKKYGFEFANITESLEPKFVAWWEHFKILTALMRLGLSVAIIACNIVKFVFPKFHNVRRLSRKEILQKIGLELLGIVGPVVVKSKYNFATIKAVLRYFSSPFEVLSKRTLLLQASGYDSCSAAMKKEREKEYIVVVDDYEIGHSDYQKTKVKFPVQDVKMYLYYLNRFYDKLEEIYDCKVIIAAHPKAEYKGDEFNGREIVYGRTTNLIRSAKLVIIELSTCFSDVILFKKNFINMCSGEYFRNQSTFHIEGYDTVKKYFGCKQLDIENEEQVNRLTDYVTCYNKKKYNKYRYNLVKDKKSIPSKGRRFYDIVYDTIYIMEYDRQKK